MKKFGLLLLGVLVAAVAGTAGWRVTHTETALEGLKNALALSTPAWAMKTLIAEEPLGEQDRLFFYETTGGRVIVARMKEEKTLWSGLFDAQGSLLEEMR